MSQQQITAIIYDKRGRVLAVGQNSYIKTHPMQALHAHKVGQHHKVFLHAEVHAITRCADISLAHAIRVFRYNKAGQPVTAAPCVVCQSAIAATPIKVIEHT
jgi:tRNA(Arg) A34 adenosine deaminase TadA